jgi:tRNA nucleotidyltransferase (CCA-adding enzyme)
MQGLPKSGMGVIMANPEQSKHLETATLRLLGLPIDLVHLRSEKYTEESRIPTIEVGTPEEDALRRDFTINSLFYNLNQQKVEDLTGRGLDDLKNGIIRTPLDPQITLMDGVLPASIFV